MLKAMSEAVCASWEEGKAVGNSSFALGLGGLYRSIVIRLPSFTLYLVEFLCDFRDTLTSILLAAYLFNEGHLLS